MHTQVPDDKKSASAQKKYADAREGVGERLTQLMGSEGADAGDLAKIAGVDQSTVSRWLNGKARPSKKYLDAIANAYAYRMEWLRDGNGDPKAPERKQDRQEPSVPAAVQGGVSKSRPVLVIELLRREIEIGLYMEVRQEPRRIKSNAVILDAEADLEAQFKLDEENAGT